MELATQTLALLRQAFASQRPPRVKALHLPPLPCSGNKAGEFGAIELESGALGLSYLLLDDTWASIGATASAVVGADALQLASAWLDTSAGAASPARAALGFAAVNALTRELFDRAGFVPPPATDSIGGLRPTAGESIGMVGHFPPLITQVTASGAHLTVLELRADLVAERPGHRVTLDPQALAACSQVLCTSTTLLNHSLARVLAACRGARRLVLIGPGASCLPDALFDRGVAALAGSWVHDRAGFIDAQARGESWSAFARKVLLERADYPGLAALCARARA
jgi:uncharacterized protein